MHELFKAFILCTIVITLWTAFLLLQDKHGNKHLNRWFAAFLVALTMPQLDLYMNQVLPGGVFKLALLASTFLWLKGPFVWAFVSVLTQKKAPLRTLVIHFIPWFCVLITLFNFPQASLTCMLLGMCHMLGYLFFSLWRLTQKRAYLSGVWYDFPNTAYYWLLYVIGGAMTLVAIDFIFMSLVLTGVLNTYDFLDYFVFLGFSIYVLSVGILSVYRPESLFRNNPNQSNLDERVFEHFSPESLVRKIYIEKDQEKDKPIEKEKFIEKEIHSEKERHLELDVDLARNLIKQLTQLMHDQHIYQRNELALPDLANYLGISVHQVSELLNVHAGLSFYDYVNGYRLKYACDLLADSNCHLRILDIAFEAGYNNKNSFYRVFKDALGVTPNQYRLNAVPEESKGSSSVTQK